MKIHIWSENIGCVETVVVDLAWEFKKKKKKCYWSILFRLDKILNVEICYFMYLKEKNIVVCG